MAMNPAGPVADPIRAEPVRVGGPERPVGGPARPIWGGRPEPVGGGGEPVRSPIASPVIGSFKKGGDVKKTGAYELHEGEHVTPASEEDQPSERHSFHRAMHSLNKGGLHRHLGIPEGEDIPHAKKVAASNSDNPHVAKMGQMAVNMEKWGK